MPRNSLTRCTARHLRFRRLVQFILAGPVSNNALKNCAARLCRTCADSPICVAVRYLTLRTGFERHGRKNPLPFSFSERSHIGNLRQIRKQGKGRSSRGRKTAGCPFFLPPRRVPRRSRRPQTANPPAEVQRKTPRPSGANPLAQFVYPAQPVLKRSRPSGANTLTQFVSPAQPVLKKLPPVRGEPACGSSCPPAGQCRKYIQKELLHPCSSSFVC